MSNTKKIAVIGQGTAGAFSLPTYLKETNWEIDWYYSSKVKPQSVGEGGNLVFPTTLHNNMGWKFTDLDKIDGSLKMGIYKQNWGDTNFMHEFPPPNISCHFSAVKLQEYIKKSVKNNKRINEIESHVENPNDLDADYVLNCSGTDVNDNLFETDTAVPVNAVLVNQCYWEAQRFQYTLTIARPYGWVFGIPLQNRCSIGYLYNKDLTSIEEVKEDIKTIFEEWNLQPSSHENNFYFNNYYRKNNFANKVVHNGNASFFLEPMEATSIGNVQDVNRMALQYWTGSANKNAIEDIYYRSITRIEAMIAIHYIVDSPFNTDFWKFAYKKASTRLKEIFKNDEEFREYLFTVLNSKKDSLDLPELGTWGRWSWNQNVDGLGIRDKILELLLS